MNPSEKAVEELAKVERWVMRLTGHRKEATGEEWSELHEERHPEGDWVKFGDVSLLCSGLEEEREELRSLAIVNGGEAAKHAERADKAEQELEKAKAGDVIRHTKTREVDGAEVLHPTDRTWAEELLVANMCGGERRKEGQDHLRELGEVRQELERVRLDLTEELAAAERRCADLARERAARIKSVAAAGRKLSQIREEVERLRERAAAQRDAATTRKRFSEGKACLALGALYDEQGDRLQAILDSAPSLLGDEKSSDEEKAVEVLRRFMCCRAGEQFVDEKLLRPFGFTLDAGRVVTANRNLIDALEWIEVYTHEAEIRDHARRAIDVNGQPSGDEESSSGAAVEARDREVLEHLVRDLPGAFDALPEDVKARYRDAEQSVIDARDSAPANEGRNVVGAAACTCGNWYHDAPCECTASSQQQPTTPVPGEPGEVERFLALKDRLLGDDAAEAGAQQFRRDLLSNEERSDHEAVQRIVAAAWNEATGHSDFPLADVLTQPKSKDPLSVDQERLEEIADWVEKGPGALPANLGGDKVKADVAYLRDLAPRLSEGGEDGLREALRQIDFVAEAALRPDPPQEPGFYLRKIREFASAATNLKPQDEEDPPVYGDPDREEEEELDLIGDTSDQSTGSEEGK